MLSWFSLIKSNQIQTTYKAQQHIAGIIIEIIITIAILIKCLILQMMVSAEHKQLQLSIYNKLGLSSLGAM